MEFSPQATSEIEEIADRIVCQFDYRCYKSGLEDLCGSPMIDSGKLVGFRHEDAEACPFSVSFGSDVLCACPLRLYIATNYGK